MRANGDVDQARWAGCPRRRPTGDGPRVVTGRVAEGEVEEGEAELTSPYDSRRRSARGPCWACCSAVAGCARGTGRAFRRRR